MKIENMNRLIKEYCLTPEGLSEIQTLASKGLTIAKIAGNLGISTSLFSKWKHNYPAIAEAVSKGKGRWTTVTIIKTTNRKQETVYRVSVDGTPVFDLSNVGSAYCCPHMVEAYGSAVQTNRILLEDFRQRLDSGETLTFHKS